MTVLSPGQLYALARDAGLGPAAAATAAAVALAESRGRSDAIGDVALEDAKWGPSVGPWQIRSLKSQYGTGGPRDASRLTDPVFNAHAMAQISGSGANFKPWSTFTSGAYKKQLSKVALGAAADAGTNPLAGIDAATDPASAATLAGLAPGGSAAVTSVNAANKFLSGWGGDATKVALYVVGAAAAAGLVVIGAVHTVK